MIETESKLCFIVDRYASKAQISEAVSALYDAKTVSVNTARTVYGKKAFIRFESAEKARDLATKIGML